MRAVLVVVALLVAACAGEKLALAPPPGVDFSGRWALNEADSDDPQRVALSQNAAPGTSAGSQGGQGGQGGRGGRGGRGGTGAGGLGSGVPGGPVMPGVGAVMDGLRWPGRDLDIKQAGGVLTMTSLGTKQVYQPVTDAKAARHPPPGEDRDPRPRGRGTGLSPLCGWDAKTLVVESENPDDDHPPFEERYSLSEDGQRLVEVVAFKGGRSGGFTVSRVWDRVPNGAPGAASTTQPAGQ